MAITAVSLTPFTKPIVPDPDHAIPFIVNAYSADFSGTEEIKAAPASGCLVVTQLSVICAVADITITIGAGETGGAVTSVIWGPVTFAGEATAAGYVPGSQFVWRPVHGIRLAPSTSLTIDASGAGAVLATAEGYTVN